MTEAEYLRVKNWQLIKTAMDCLRDLHPSCNGLRNQDRSMILDLLLDARIQLENKIETQ